jgi:glyoxylase-like metal-dependent hydrolase (beta-lactamase superfamily II)
MILKQLVVGPFASNCFIIGSESTKQGMVIDPGADGEAILRTIDKLGLSINLVVATHLHHDHTGAIKEVCDSTGADFAVHEEEGEGGFGALSHQLASSMMAGSFGHLPEPKKLLKDGDKLDIGDLYFTVLYTPGHSPGGISIVGHGVVFSGDTLFNSSIGRTDFPGCSYAQLMDSIQNKLMTLPDDTVVYPGHGPATTIGDERRSNPFLR